MLLGLTITVVDVDPDYMGLEIHASNYRFAGSTWIYAGLTELSKFANRVAGFPAHATDERTHEFGSLDPKFAGGYCSLRFYCIDGVGHARVDVVLEDDHQMHPNATAKFALPVLAADIDRFTNRLRIVEQEQFGEAVLPAAV